MTMSRVILEVKTAKLKQVKIGCDAVGFGTGRKKI